MTLEALGDWPRVAEIATGEVPTVPMIGLPATPSDPQSVLAHGTRVAFQTR